MISFSGMILPMILIIPGHVFFLWIAGFGGRLFGFNEKDRIAILFCAPQKTLAMGLPLIAAVLSSRPELEGLATLPVILYHPIQLVIAGFLEQRIQRGKSH
jgi:sodium/bile acid cotransporter 7